MGHPCRCLMLDHRRLAAAKRADDPRQQHGQAIAPGVDDSRLAQHREQVGAALHRVLTRLERALDHLCDHGVLFVCRGLRPQPGVSHVRQLRCDPHRHLAHDREDRSFRRIAHRAIRLVHGPRQCRADQNRIDQLSGSRRKLLRRTTDQLREDHAGVSAGAQQRRPGDGRDNLLPADVIDRALL